MFVTMPIEQMPMVRVLFSKTGRAKYTSHLDTMRTLTRAFRRSGLPVWYTQGFNPHLYMTFALPVALGYESLCESVDIRLTQDIPFEAVTQKLNTALPPGFKAVRAAKPVNEPSAIAYADYDVRLIYEIPVTGSIEQKLESFLALPVIEAQKKTKKGMKTVDIKPLSKVASTKIDGNVMELNLRMAAGIELNINPTLLLKAFYDWSGVLPEGVKIMRTAILDKTGADFE